MAMHTRWLALDVETLPDTAAEPFLKPVEPHKGYTDPEKIARDIATKTEAQRAEMSLDPFACCIAVLGWQTESHTEPQTLMCYTEDDERAALHALAGRIHPGSYQHERRPILGYHALGFDWPVILTRARLLGVALPAVDTRRYGNRDIVDIYAALTVDGTIANGVIKRSLAVLARRFGLPVEDDVDGSQVAALWAAGEYQQVAAHCRSDVSTTVALAQRLGLIACRHGMVSAAK